MKPWLWPMRRSRNHQTPKNSTIGRIQDNRSPEQRTFNHPRDLHLVLRETAQEVRSSMRMVWKTLSSFILP